MKRRGFLGTAAAVSSALAGCLSTPDSEQNGSETAGETETAGQAETQTKNLENLPEAVGLEELASGLEGPLDVAFVGGRRYIAEQRGTIAVHTNSGLGSEPLLDLRGQIEVGGEKGLLGIAVHPQDEQRLFVRYSAPAREGTPSNYSHTFVLAEFQMADSGDSVRPDSERTVMEIPQPQGNHNAGDIVFGPEGYLYIAVGDGGAGGDQGLGHVEDWYDDVGGGNGQDVTENLLGSILRIDVDAEPVHPPLRGNPGDYDSRAGYAIPPENPLVGEPGLDEHFAWGLRNPWQLAFDRGKLYAGDVGQSKFEEVNRIEAGGNYGWNVKEATHCYSADECPDRTPKDIRGRERLRDPVIEYPHSDAPVSGISVIGGTIYRGSTLSSLDGLYVFGDYRAEGELFVAAPSEEKDWPTAVVAVAPDDADKLNSIRWFGRHDGELYVVGTGERGGALYRVVSAEG